MTPGERAVIYDVFEPKITHLFSTLVAKDSIIFDVGSWIGYYALLAAYRGARKVVAIEADPENVERINQNIKANEGFDKIIEVKHVGISSTKGKLKIERRKDSRVMSHILESDDGEILQDTLDEVARGIISIDLMMMDIEGHEIYALQGSRQLLKEKRIKNLLIEVHPKFLKQNGQSEDELIMLLRNYDYAVKKIASDSPSTFHILASS
jgi:FkbM family methyltransferase